jgi:hypothetical protein
LTKTRWPQPTAQYGHTDRATLSAVSVRGVRLADLGDCTARPRPSGSSLVSCRYTGQRRRRNAMAFVLSRPVPI